MERIVENLCEVVGKSGLSCGTTVLDIRFGHVLLAIILGLTVGLVVRVFFKRTPESRGFTVIPNINFETNPSSEAGLGIYFNPHDLARALGREDLDGMAKTKIEKNLNKKIGSRYFRVEIRENGNLLVNQEMKVKARSYKLQSGDARVDGDTIEILREKNESIEDDEMNGGGVYGNFEIRFRPIRWWDVRHWLTHPNRDIRLGLWVAIIAVLIEYSPQITSAVSVTLAAAGR